MPNLVGVLIIFNNVIIVLNLLTSWATDKFSLVTKTIDTKTETDENLSVFSNLELINLDKSKHWDNFSTVAWVTSNRRWCGFELDGEVIFIQTTSNNDFPDAKLSQLLETGDNTTTYTIDRKELIYSLTALSKGRDWKTKWSDRTEMTFEPNGELSLLFVAHRLNAQPKKKQLKISGNATNKKYLVLSACATKKICNVFRLSHSDEITITFDNDTAKVKGKGEKMVILRDEETTMLLTGTY